MALLFSRIRHVIEKSVFRADQQIRHAVFVPIDRRGAGSQALIAADDMERQYKTIIILTDGEDHEEEVETYSGIAEREGIVVYTVGIGSLEGVPIPEYNDAGLRTGYKKDSEGNTVVTKLDEVTLQKIALTTGGKYYHASPEESELDKLFEEISAAEKKELGSFQFTQFEDRFQYFIGAALILLVFELFYSDRRKVIGDSGG